MKKSLAHLPKHKRDELKLVTEIILDECPTVLMIVLFGSYARGDWVEDTYVENHVTYEYASDFDLLLVIFDSNTALELQITKLETLHGIR